MDEETKKQIEEVLKTQPMYITRNGKIEVIIYGDTRYDYDIADLLREKTPEEIEKLKKMARLEKLLKEVEQLKAEVAE